MTSAMIGVRPRSLVHVAHYPPGSTFGPRLLRDFEFVWVLRGAARWRVSTPAADSQADVREVELRPGTLALARPGTSDSYLWDDPHTSSHAYVHFEVEDSTALSPESWPLTRPLAGHDPLGALCGYLLDLASVGGSPERARSDRIVGLLLDIFLTGPFPQDSPDLRISPRLLPALEHVRQVWEQERVRLVPVPELASAAGISTGHFSRSFADAFGCGPSSALELVRLGRAATALQRSNLTISDIAQHNGFADAYHFSKRFTAAYGMPPGKFRRGGEQIDPLSPLAARGLLGLWASVVNVL